MTRKKSRHNFSYYYPRNNPTYPVVAASIQDNQSNVAAYVSYLISRSQFNQWGRDEIYENLYIDEPSIASSVDSYAVMVSEAYNYIDSKYTNKPPSLLRKIKDKLLIGDKQLIEQMVFEANEIASELSIEDIYEAYAAVAFMNGTLFIEKKKDLSISVIPNTRVTVIDKLDRLNTASKDITDIITQPNFLVIDEGLGTERILNKDQFYIIKFRETPLIVEDCKGRFTFNIYSVSPLRRAISPIWYKRIAMGNDALWRAKSVPREHHKIASETFNTDNFMGTKEQRIAAAQAAADSALSSYKALTQYQAPDQNYITLDNVNIEMIEPTSTSYMRANELIEQMNQETYAAMNLPQSVVRGVSNSNYASELIISSFTSTKVKQMARKISKVILPVIKERLLVINKKFPVDQLDIKISFTLANSRLEQFKIAQVMGAMGTYYANEIREITDHEPLPDELNFLVDTASKITPTTRSELGKLGEEPPSDRDDGQPAVNNGGQSLSSDGSVNYPTTTHSAEKQPTDSGDAIFKTSTTPKN